jgi:hypothetical protein
MPGTSRRGADRTSRLARAAALSGTSGKVCPADRATLLLEAIIEPGDRVTIEGDNQKQADFLASALAKVDPARVQGRRLVYESGEWEIDLARRELRARGAPVPIGGLAGRDCRGQCTSISHIGNSQGARPGS